MGTDSLCDWTGRITLAYVIALGWTDFMSAIFTMVALAFQFRVLSFSKLMTWSARLTATWTTRNQHRAHPWAWMPLIALLLVLQISFHRLSCYRIDILMNEGKT